MRWRLRERACNRARRCDRARCLSSRRHRMRGHAIGWQRRRLEIGAGLHHLIAGDDVVDDLLRVPTRARRWRVKPLRRHVGQNAGERVLRALMGCQLIHPGSFYVVAMLREPHGQPCLSLTFWSPCQYRRPARWSFTATPTRRTSCRPPVNHGCSSTPSRWSVTPPTTLRLWCCSWTRRSRNPKPLVCWTGASSCWPRSSGNRGSGSGLVGGTNRRIGPVVRLDG